MALPPMNPSRTAAGITVDPQTLERVVPTSRRKDGSVRKELKIRPGFTPQEDVGRFRGSRQQASDQGSAIPGSGPGSGSTRMRPPPSSKPDNPFASVPSTSSSQTKTKAQVKNEKRREKKKTAKAWDESGDDSDEEDISEAFKAEEARRTGTEPQPQPQPQDVKDEKRKDDEPAWPIDDGGQGMISEAAPDGGGPPDQPIPIEPAVEDKKDDDEGETAILSPVPAGPETKDPAAPIARPTPAPTPSTQTSTSTSTATPSTPEWRTAPSRRPQKPHPIQGGRQGPIGLAHPPPIESESKPRPNRSRQNSSRLKKAGTGAGDVARQPHTRPQNVESAKSQPPAQIKEPRVRKEVKVRDTGMGSLADRVKNLVIGTQGSEQKKEKPAPAPKSEPAATA